MPLIGRRQLLPRGMDGVPLPPIGCWPRGRDTTHHLLQSTTGQLPGRQVRERRETEAAAPSPNGGARHYRYKLLSQPVGGWEPASCISLFSSGVGPRNNTPSLLWPVCHPASPLLSSPSSHLFHLFPPLRQTWGVAGPGNSVEEACHFKPPLPPPPPLRLPAILGVQMP